MRNKWLRRIKRFIEIFTPGGTAYTNFGTEFRVGHFGGISTPDSEVKKIMHKARRDWEAEIARSKASRSDRI
jgi:hypothetical protein